MVSSIVDERVLSVSSFRTLLDEETRRLNSLCTHWGDILENDTDARITDSIKGDIRSVVGQAKLVISERFHQFSGLVDNCQFNRGEKKTTQMDLRGFWEMIYCQVEDVNQKFMALEKQKQSNWEQEDEMKKTSTTILTTTSRKRTCQGQSQASYKATASSGLKALIAAKRKKVSKSVDESKFPDTVTKRDRECGETSENPSSPEKTFDGGFFKIKSPFPQLSQVSSSRITRSAGCFRSMRRTEVSESAKRMSGLVSPFVSQLARRSLITGNVSVRKSSLFDEMDEEEKDDTNKENFSKEFWHFKKYC